MSWGDGALVEHALSWWFDELQRAHAPAVVSGPGAQYFFAAARGRLITTIINHSADTWHGTITAPIAGAVSAVREYVGDTSVACTRAGARVTVPAHVPPYDARVFAIEYAPDATGPGAGC